MPFTRDPLSERYDAAAARLVAQARSRPGRWASVLIPRPRGRSAVLQIMREAGIELEAADAGGLTPWERAFQRSAYWVFKDRRLDDAWGMQRKWGPRRPGGRLFAVRLSPRDVAYRAATRLPRREKYTADPALRSGGEGSTLQRF